VWLLHVGNIPSPSVQHQRRRGAVRWRPSRRALQSGQSGPWLAPYPEVCRTAELSGCKASRRCYAAKTPNQPATGPERGRATRCGCSVACGCLLAGTI
jgi:hypothetical protein